MKVGDIELQLPVTLDQLLDQVADELVGRRRGRTVAGAHFNWDLGHDFGHIWGAVSRFPDLFNLFADFVGRAGGFVGWLIDRFLDVLRWVNSARDTMWSWISSTTGGVWRWIWDRTGWVFQNVWDAANGMVAWVIDRASWLWNLVSPAFAWVYNWVTDRARWVFQNVWDAAGGVTAWIIDRAQWVFQNVWDAAGGLTAWVIDRASWLWSVISPAFGQVGLVLWNAARWMWEHTSDSLAIAFGETREFFTDVKDTVVESTTTIVREVGGAVIAGAQGIGEFFKSGLEWLFEHVFEPIKDAIAVKMSIPRKLLTGEYSSPEQLLADFEDPFNPASLAAYGLMIPGSILGLLGAMSEAGSIIFEPAVQRAAKSGGHTIPNLTDLRDAFLRGFMDPGRHDDWLGRMGFSEDNIAIIRQLYFDLPTPSDLIRMAVREVFSPDVVERFGQMQDFPPDFARFAKQIGISDEWAHAHWAAHWDLPSATQGFEMFHRNVLDRGTLELLLRTLDVMPFWRDKLIQIAYRIVGRIDTRRLYRTGVWDRARVLRAYLDQGYAPQDAEHITDFVVREASGVSKDLPRETVLKFYRQRRITRDETVGELEAQGWDADTIELFLDDVDLDIEEQRGGLLEDIVELDFKRGAIGEGSVRQQLDLAGVPAERVDLLLDLWSRQVAVKDQRLSPAQLLRLFRSAIISEPVLRDRLSRQGYDETDVTYLIQLAHPEEAAPEPRELTKADLRAALRQGVLDEPAVRGRLGQEGYAPADVNVLIATWQPT